MIETISKYGMVGLLAVAIPVQSSDTTIWANWGLAGLVVGYVLWRDHNREKRLSDAIENQQKWIRNTLVDSLERNAKAMERMVSWLERDHHNSEETSYGNHG